MSVYFLTLISFGLLGCAFSIMAGKWFSKSADAKASGVAAGVLFMTAPLPMLWALRAAFEVFTK